MMPCYYWFAKLIKKAGCVLGTFSGAPRVGCGEMDVARVVQHKRQHYTPPTQPSGQTTECLQSEAPSAPLQ